MEAPENPQQERDIVMDLSSTPGAKLHPARPAMVTAPGPIAGDDFERLQAEIRAISARHGPDDVEPDNFTADDIDDVPEQENDALVQAVAAVQPTDLARVKETAVTMLANLHAKASVREDDYEMQRASLVYSRAAARTEIVQGFRRQMEAVKQEALAVLEEFDRKHEIVQAIRNLDAANERARAEDVRLTAILRTMKDG